MRNEGFPRNGFSIIRCGAIIEHESVAHGGFLNERAKRRRKLTVSPGR